MSCTTLLDLSRSFGAGRRSQIESSTFRERKGEFWNRSKSLARVYAGTKYESTSCETKQSRPRLDLISVGFVESSSFRNRHRFASTARRSSARMDIASASCRQSLERRYTTKY